MWPIDELTRPEASSLTNAGTVNFIIAEWIPTDKQIARLTIGHLSTVREHRALDLSLFQKAFQLIFQGSFLHCVLRSSSNQRI
jgi:hypothetical protein